MVMYTGSDLMVEIKDTHLSISVIGLIVILYLVFSYLSSTPISDAIIFGAFTAVAGLAGFEAGRDK